MGASPGVANNRPQPAFGRAMTAASWLARPFEVPSRSHAAPPGPGHREAFRHSFAGSRPIAHSADLHCSSEFASAQRSRTVQLQEEWDFNPALEGVHAPDH